MARSVALAHLVRQDDGTSEGIWAGHALRSAFQPIFGFRDGRLEVAAHEGLLRAFRGNDTVSPVTFFASIPAIDRLHVETLTRTLHLLNAAVCLDDGVSIFVNFNPSVFTERAVADVALREMRLVLHEAGIDARRVVCEVTEQRSASTDALFGLIDALRAHGFRIAVDDYGADDSDIARVAELKPDIVKFDAHWISKLIETRAGHSLLATMVRIFEDKGIRTVFEGIEEPWQVDRAAEAGVSMLQGYALGRPQLAAARKTAPLASRLDPVDPPAAAQSDSVPLPSARLAHRPTRTFGRRISPA